MGCNYYVQEKPPCECCKRPFELIHIGKLSGGWAFSFCPHEDLGLTSAQAWFSFLALNYIHGGTILDEYDQVVELKDLLRRIEDAKGGLIGATASRDSYGSSDWRNYERVDEQGYRFMLREGFS